MERSFELDLEWGTMYRGLDLLRKKKQTLEGLFTSEKISKSTYEFLDRKLIEETTNLESQLKSLADSMTARAQELEKQIEQLEISLANLEMYHATEELDDKTYEKQNETILLSLQATKRELENVKNSLLNIVSLGTETIEETPTISTEAEESIKVKENEEIVNIQTTSLENNPPSEQIESAEINVEVTAGATPQEQGQSKDTSLVDAFVETSKNSNDAETASEQ